MSARAYAAITAFLLLGACHSSAPATPPATAPDDDGVNILAPRPRSTEPLPPVDRGPPVAVHPSDDVHCLRDAECLVSTFQECCGAAPAHGARKDVERAHVRDCERMLAEAQCIDFDNLQELVTAKDFVAKCAAGVCSIEPKKR